MSDLLDLLRLAQGGDEVQFACLVNRLHSGIVCTAWLQIGDRDLAEDIAQEVWILFYRRLEQFDFSQPEQLRTWLHRAALNIARDLRGKKGPTPVDAKGAFLESLAELTLESQSFDEDDQNLVEEAMRTLEPAEWLIIRLRVYEEMTHAEIVKLGVLPPQSEEQSRQLLYRARRHLETQLWLSCPELANRLFGRETLERS